MSMSFRCQHIKKQKTKINLINEIISKYKSGVSVAEMSRFYTYILYTLITCVSCTYLL